MTGPESLRAKIGLLRTRMGTFYPGEKVIFRGHDLHADLKGIDWVELYLFGITGRRFAPSQVKMLHALWAHTSYPDGRIWNNRVAALAGSARSTPALGVAAALAVSDANIYGGGVNIEAIDFILDTRQRIDAGEALASCVRDRLKTFGRVGGYGRPLFSQDERIEPTMVLARDLGLAEGRHTALAFEVGDYLVNSRYKMGLNYGGLAAAFAADLGLSPAEYGLFMFPAFLAGMPPCYIESSENPEGTLFPLPCDGIRYEGVEKRAWPGTRSP